MCDRAWRGASPAICCVCMEDGGVLRVCVCVTEHGASVTCHMLCVCMKDGGVL